MLVQDFFYAFHYGHGTMFPSGAAYADPDHFPVTVSMALDIGKNKRFEIVQKTIGTFVVKNVAGDVPVQPCERREFRDIIRVG